MSTRSRPISLASNTIDSAEIARLVDWLQSEPRLTKGPVTLDFEERWASTVGTQHALFVNSGSSANLLMIYALVLSGRLSSDRIVVPSLAWATDLAPLIQLGLEPVLADVSLEDLAVDLDHLEELFRKRAPAALLLVSVLGIPPDMTALCRLCEEYGVILLEDACESLGARHRDQPLGSFGLMSSFSLYYGHHLSTIEGGVVCTDDDELAETLVMLRSHGWDRDLPRKRQQELRSEAQVDDFTGLYTFYLPGFNLRSTDLQAYLGLGQLDKLDAVIRRRNDNYCLYRELLDDEAWCPTVSDAAFVSSFAYPMLHEKRSDIVTALAAHDVETRPLICGSMGSQPFFVARYGRQILPGATVVDETGFYLPNHHGLSANDVEHVVEIVNDVIRA